MKNYRYYIAVLACAVLALSGCNKEPGFTTGKAIRFGAGTKGESLTKTSYGDIYTENTSNGKDADGKRKQMVEWEDGDLIRIACAQASTTEEGTSTIADYKTTPIGTGATTNADKDGRHEFRATLSLPSSTDKGLRWGSESDAHVFYGVYPSPATNGKSADALTDGGVLTGSIPQNQPVAVSGSGPYEASVDMTNLYMVAKKTVAAHTQNIGENEVFLYFTPITTAIEFEVENGMSDALSISSIEILSASKKLSGKFKTELSTIPAANEDGFYYPAVTANGDNSLTASVTFGDAGYTLAVGQKLTFTIFLLPEDDLDDLTFKINKKDGTYIKTALMQVESGSTTPTFIKFDCYKKHFVKGLFVNEGAQWTVCFAPGVSSWIENGTDKDLDDPAAAGSPYLASWDQGGESDHLNLGKPVEYKFSLATGVSDTQTFNPAASDWNVKTLGISSTKDSESEGWVNEPQGWKIKTVGGKAVTGNSYTTSDGLLTVEKDGNNLKVTDKRQKISYGDNAHWITSGTDWYSQSWGSETGGLNKGTVDLSKYDFENDSYSSTNPMRTANCYIVRHAGTYKIPLVYGNAIDYGKSGLTNGNNKQSYAPSIASGGSNGLTPFVNHLGNGIFDPYIENNTIDGKVKNYTPASGKPGTGNYKPAVFNKYIEAKSAKVIWQDVEGVISSVGIPESSPNGDETSTGLVNTASNVRHVQFTISQTNIRQCNAVIAVYDGANGTGNILWSWHIWITNNPDLGQQAIAVTNNAGKTSSFLAAPAIGWIDPDFYEKKNDVKIVLEQEESGEQITVTTKHPEYTYYGHGSCYQFGRKDPMRYNVTTDTNAATTVEIKTSILNPGTFYTKWIGLDKYNLWTGKESKKYSLIELLGSDTYAEEGSDKIKTIYDPSPAGYKVPSVKAFTGFTKDGQKCGGEEGTYQLTDSNVSGSYHHGWDFYTNSSHTSTIYFPSAYCRISTGAQGSGGIGRYRTSTANSDSDDGSFEFQFQSTYVYPMTEKSSKANALPIRPITE